MDSTTAQLSPAEAAVVTALLSRPRGSLVTSPELRQATGLDKAECNQACLGVSRRDIAYLARHDYPSSLSANELAELIYDPTATHDGNHGRYGTYYVGMALWPRR